MSSLNALSRTSSIATERRGADASSGAGGAFQSIQDAFAAMMGELGISADGTGAAGQTPATQDATAKTEPPQGALATLTGGSVLGAEFFDLSHLILSPTTAPSATGEQASTEASGAGIATAATSGVETDATTDPLGLALIAATGVAPATTTGTTTDAATTGTNGANAAATQASSANQDGAQAAMGATPPGLPPAGASPSEIANTAMTTLRGLLGLGAEASADDINAAIASVRAAIPQTGATAVAASAATSGVSANGKKPATATNSVGASTASSSANGVPVAGATAAFEGDGATGSGAGADTGGETANPEASQSNATLAQAANANQRGGTTQSTSPLMAAALSFVERMQADQDSAETEADALGAATSGTTARTDTAALQSTAASSATAGREAAIPLPLLASEIARQAQQGKKAFDIRLDPPELGKVRVKLELGQEGEVRAHLIVERKETLDMLQRDQRVLERALQDAGLSLNGGGLQFSLSNGGQQSSYEQASSDTAAPLTEAETDTQSVATAVATYTSSRRPGGIDLSV